MGLKIGVVSKLSGFSPSGIRYFEERGIVSPSHGRDGTYRSFDLPDVARLLECRNYRECGCDSSQIALLLKDGPIDEVEHTLLDCETRLREQIEAAQSLESFLAHRRQMLRAIGSGVPGKVDVVRSPATYWAPLWMPGEHDDVEPRIPSEEDGFPIPFADSSLLFPEGLAASSDAVAPVIGYAVHRQYVRRPPTLKGCAFLGSRKCAHSIIRVGQDFAPDPEDLAGLSKAMSKLGLVQDTPAFSHRICTIYGNGAERRYDEIWVPVE